MKKLIRLIMICLQWLLLRASYYFTQFFFVIAPKFKKRHERQLVIGVMEITGNIYNLAQLFPNSYSIVLEPHGFYRNHQYSFQLKRTRLIRLKQLILGPILLGYFTNLSDHFLYVFSAGFLYSIRNDYQFLKAKNKKIIHMFCGGEIRSEKLTREFCQSIDYDCFYDYIKTDARRETQVKHLAEIVGQYANVIINWDIDQMAYLAKETIPFFYMIQDKIFNKNEAKFNAENKIIKILHASSYPVAKGTQLVRAAIKKLKQEGYHFEYKELMGVPHETVIEELRHSQIVLNEFYCFTPGVFGIEAMANYNAVLTSADPEIERLPEGANKAWLRTRYWEVYDHLKMLLDTPALIKEFAENGLNFTKKYYSMSALRKRIPAELGLQDDVTKPIASTPNI